MQPTNRLYSDLAWLWPLWGTHDTDYAEYAGHVVAAVQAHAQRPVEHMLNIGCGGGKNAWNLKSRFKVTGVDLSPVMLAQAQALNPQCTFVQGDMRDFELGRRFDAVLMDDAISYMATLDDFRAAMARAHAHLETGGVLITTPDVTAEHFEQNRTQVTPVTRAGLDVVFIENVYDPDPSDTHYETTVVYLIREQGVQRVETDHWRLGLFPMATWHQVLTETGFEVHEHRFGLGDESYTLLACTKS